VLFFTKNTFEDDCLKGISGEAFWHIFAGIQIHAGQNAIIGSNLEYILTTLL